MKNNARRIATLLNLKFAIWTKLQLPPYILKIVETFLAYNPLGRAHCTFGEAAAGSGVVAEGNCVVQGLEDDLVHTHDLAFPERKGFPILPATGPSDHLLNRNFPNRGACRRPAPCSLRSPRLRQLVCDACAGAQPLPPAIRSCRGRAGGGSCKGYHRRDRGEMPQSSRRNSWR